MNELIKYYNNTYGKKENKNYLLKLPYPSTKKDFYRAYSFLDTVIPQLGDEKLLELLQEVKLPYPNNIDELSLYMDCSNIIKGKTTSGNIKLNPKGTYSVKKTTDTFETLYNAIKEGKTLLYQNTPCVWSLNKEEKIIDIKDVKSFGGDN